MPAFDRLHPSLRHAIVHELGWRSLRPVQEQAIDAVLDGDNAVVLAPTAGGKTEAALFPVLSSILDEEPAPVAALYVCPIRALLNNIEERVQRYARMVGLDAFKWHGDVSASAKDRFRAEPSHLLLITPESLEVMLIGEKTDAAALFGPLRAVVVDEIHAFAADDRGAHLVAILERLSRFCGRDLQRIGLSATVGNPDEIGRWLQGSSERRFRRVDPPRERPDRDLGVDLVEDEDALARSAALLTRGKKSLVFVESRGQAERVAAAMTGRGVEVFIHHSAVSRSERALAEKQFAGGQSCAIVCTSTMELGLDVGDLDQVVQVDSPATVSSLLQRMGRTGRRPGTRASCTVLCRSAESLLQATAILRLLERGFVDDVRPSREAAHVLAHQIIALSLQEGGVSRHRVLPWIAAASPFAGLSSEDVTELVDTMVDRAILHEADGLLSLGQQGEALYGRKSFFELYSVFSVPRVLAVMHEGSEVGSLQELFLRDAIARANGPAAFRLAGRAWQVARVDWRRGVCDVQPADHGRVPTWLGVPRYLSNALCQEMKRALGDDCAHAWLAPPASAELAQLREDYADLVDPEATPVEEIEEGVLWHTFAGGAVNRLLAAALEEVGGGRWTSGNLALKAAHLRSTPEAVAYTDRLRDLDWLAVAGRLAANATSDTISKFQPCLPPRLETKLKLERLVDVEGAARVVEQGARTHEK